jgi:hypothetical protein
MLFSVRLPLSVLHPPLTPFAWFAVSFFAGKVRTAFDFVALFFFTLHPPSWLFLTSCSNDASEA